MGSSIDLHAIGHLVEGPEAKLQRDAVTDLLNMRYSTFPGAQPVSFARKHLQELQHVDYFMCEKTDGVRCLLYLTQIYIKEENQFVEAQFLIDRKNDYYFIPRDLLHLPAPESVESYHTGSLLDGELVRQTFKHGQERIAYLIFDCLAIDGDDVRQKTFDKRVGRVGEFIIKPFKALAKQYPQDIAAQPFQIELKTMEFPYAMDMMFRDKIPNLPHGNDGLIFTCKNTPYVSGTDAHILKWKPPHENTIDFRLLLGAFPMVEDSDGAYEDWDAKPDMELHINHGDRAQGYKWYGDMTVSQSEWDAMKRMNQQLDGRIIECYKENSQWRPKIEKDGSPRFRDDKKDANHISTAGSVQESIDDAVTEHDLISSQGKIREAFKARQKSRDEEAKRFEEKRRQAQEESKRKASEFLDYDDGPTYTD